MKYIFILITIFFLTFPLNAEPTKQWLTDFVAASETARQPKATDADIERYLSMMADDLLDVHTQYNVEIDKDTLRKGLKNNRETMVSVVETIEDLILGSDTAVLVVNETSSYYRRGTLKNFTGRTILVLHFNDAGLIKVMRRYLHQ